MVVDGDVKGALSLAWDKGGFVVKGNGFGWVGGTEVIEGVEEFGTAYQPKLETKSIKATSRAVFSMLE